MYLSDIHWTLVSWPGIDNTILPQPLIWLIRTMTFASVERRTTAELVSLRNSPPHSVSELPLPLPASLVLASTVMGLLRARQTTLRLPGPRLAPPTRSLQPRMPPLAGTACVESPSTTWALQRLLQQLCAVSIFNCKT